VALCGAISAYNATQPQPGPRNLALAIGKRLTLRGFIVGDHEDLRPAFEREMAGWLADGAIAWRETTVDGIESAVEGFRQLLAGGNTGKMVIRL
jgi:NADPH-dependent curcumin reductase CurA